MLLLVSSISKDHEKEVKNQPENHMPCSSSPSGKWDAGALCEAVGIEVLFAVISTSGSHDAPVSIRARGCASGRARIKAKGPQSLLLSPGGPQGVPERLCELGRCCPRPCEEAAALTVAFQGCCELPGDFSAFWSGSLKCPAGPVHKPKPL